MSNEAVEQVGAVLDSLESVLDDRLKVVGTATPPPSRPNWLTYSYVALTWAFNLSGHPAASVPAGFAADGTPVGLQIVADHHREDLLLRATAALQRLKPWPSPRYPFHPIA